MDLALIERLMQLLERSTLDELDLTQDGVRIRLSKSGGRSADAATGPLAPPAPFLPAAETGSNPGRPAPHEIVAGLPGTFYRAPAPGEKPFVSVGARVEEGCKLALIEAMKMMNPVEADCDGIVTEIHLADGAPVSPGMVLFTIGQAEEGARLP